MLVCMAFILLIRALYHNRCREEIHKMLLEKKISCAHFQLRGGKKERKGGSLWALEKGVACCCV